MKDKVGEYFDFFRQARYRDAAVFTTTTLSGALIGMFRSIGQSGDVMRCNVLCDTAYGAYTGITLTFSLILLDHFLNKSGYQEIPSGNKEYII